MNKLSLKGLFRTPSNPKAHIDVMKIIATYMVLFNHSGQNGYSLYQVELDQPLHWLILSHSILIKMAVPLFFMSSGALLLGREESYQKVFFQRFLHFAGTLVAASFIVYNMYVRNVGPFTLITDWKTAGDFLTRLYTNDVSFPFWYMYSYLAFLLMMPLLHKIAVNMKMNDFIWIIAAFILAQNFPIIDYAIFHGTKSHTTYFSFFVETRHVVYPLIGYYLENKLEDRHYTPEAFLALVCLSILAVGSSYILVEWHYGQTGLWTDSIAESCLGSLVIVPAITVYFGLKLLMTGVLKKPRPRITRFLSIVSSCTFGVYLFELILRLKTSFIFQFFYPYVGAFFSTCLQILGAVIIGITLTYIWKILVGIFNIYKQKLTALLKTKLGGIIG